tara:strand:+ start:14718 stop:15323 length:606 start_codon:yes stop_codon:yes gene_type:complete
MGWYSDWVEKNKVEYDSPYSSNLKSNRDVGTQNSNEQNSNVEGAVPYLDGMNVGPDMNPIFNPVPENFLGSAGVEDQSGGNDQNNNSGQSQQANFAGLSNFDMDDPESVKALQTKLGVRADGMFGPKTEQAYRAAIDTERQAQGQESLRYDYNEGGPAAKTKVGGFLKNAYSNLDKSIGGILPGGYKKNKSDMTAEERGSY